MWGAKNGLVSNCKKFLLWGNSQSDGLPKFIQHGQIILFSNPGEKTEVVIGGKPARNADSVATAGGDTFIK